MANKPIFPLSIFRTWHKNKGLQMTPEVIYVPETQFSENLGCRPLAVHFLLTCPCLHFPQGSKRAITTASKQATESTYLCCFILQDIGKKQRKSSKGLNHVQLTERMKVQACLLTRNLMAPNSWLCEGWLWLPTDEEKALWTCSGLWEVMTGNWTSQMRTYSGAKLHGSSLRRS